jgi:predicted metal-dependent hydrolase
MATKIIEIPEIGNVTLHKRRDNRNIRLKIDATGKVSVSMPHFVPYLVATEYVKKNHAWIKHELDKRITHLYEGMSIGRLHTLRFQHDLQAITPKTRVTANEVIVRHATTPTHVDVQSAAKKASIRALRQQAHHFLPKRLKDIALSEGYKYRDVSIKQMKGRWGSCNQDKSIVLNIFLMELPIELIDYVILHELAHTRALNHSQTFWQELETHVPNARDLRRKLRKYQPTIPAQSVS